MTAALPDPLPPAPAASARPPPAGRCAPAQLPASDEAAQAWLATQEAVATVDAAVGAIVWCTPPFRAMWGSSFPDVPALAARWPLLADALAQGRTATRPARLNLPAPASTAGEALAGSTATWVAEVFPSLDGRHVSLRLRPDEGEATYVQRQIQDRERMVFTSRTLSVGEMATTLAHELNQPLGTITNVLHGLRRRLEGAQGPLDTADLLQGVQMATDQAQFAARVITRIRSHTLTRQPVRERIGLPALMRECVALLDWDIQHLGVRATLCFEPTAQKGLALGDAVMLQQVLINLMRNAMDAMQATPRAERRLTLSLRHQPPLTRGLKAEWILQVSDTGCGIDGETQGRLFTPFASSKPNGMGIGLNICRSFIELHEGRLWFTRNERAAGSTFHVALPVAPEMETPDE